MIKLPVWRSGLMVTKDMEEACLFFDKDGKFLKKEISMKAELFQQTEAVSFHFLPVHAINPENIFLK